MPDKHPQGGDLFEMAKDGTHVPEDAAKPRIIKSVPGPETQDAITDAPSANGVGEGMTGTGDALPASTTAKHLGGGHGGKESNHGASSHKDNGAPGA